MIMCKGCKNAWEASDDITSRNIETAHCHDDVTNGYHKVIVYKLPENKYN